MMEISIATEADRGQWDEIVASSAEGTLFHTWKWLKIMEKHNVKKQYSRIFKGKLYPLIVWEGNEIYANCSSDYGATWTGAKKVNSDVPYPYDIQTDPQVCTDGQGNFHVAWIDNRGGTGLEKYPFVTRSTDSGKTWQPDRSFDSGYGVVTLNPRVSCDSQGDVYYIWRQNR